MPTLCKYNHTKINIFFGYATYSSEKNKGGLCKKKRNKRCQETKGMIISKCCLRSLFCLLIPFYLLCPYKNGLNYLTKNSILLTKNNNVFTNGKIFLYINFIFKINL